MKYYYWLYHFIRLLVCLQISALHNFSHSLKWRKKKERISLLLLFRMCASQASHLHTQIIYQSYPITEWMRRILYHLLALLMNAEQCSVRLPFLPLCLSWFVSVSLTSSWLNSGLLLTHLLVSVEAILAGRLICLADRHCEGKLGLSNIWVTFLTDWDIWLGDSGLADHRMM